jgi:MerR family regulatory protein
LPTLTAETLATTDGDPSASRAPAKRLNPRRQCQFGRPACFPSLIYAIVSTMERIVSISAAAEVLGVSITTLRRWEAAGKLVAEHTAGGHRRYDLAKLRPELFRAADQGKRKTIAYARLSSPDQKDDLERQQQLLQRYCTGKAGRSTRWPTSAPA